MDTALQIMLATLQKLEPAVRSFASSRGHDDAEAFYDQVWWRCVEYICAGPRHSRDIPALIWTTARGKLMDFYRARVRRPAVLPLQYDPPGKVSQSRRMSDRADRLYAVLSELGGRAREAFRLKYACDWSDAEIAEALGMSKNGVRTLNFRTRKLLAERLSPSTHEKG